MKNLLGILLIFVYHNSVSQSVITIQRGNTVKLETRFDSAIAHAQDGDYIYLPGGLIVSGGSIEIKKKVSIFGAGYRSDSSAATSPTLIQAEISLTEGAEGSFITGISSTNNITIYQSNIIITRCSIHSLHLNNYISNILVEENIIRNGLHGSASYSSTTFKKNVVYGLINGFNKGGITFLNNIFFDATQFGYSHLFQNNIFAAAGSFSSGSSSFINNLFVGNFSTAYNGAGNIFNEPLTNIFVNYTSGAEWNHSQNFHLKAGCKGIGLGTDGKDAGIYGSGTPFKEGAIPFNPHYQKVVIPSATNANGKLEISITVQAQNH